MFQISVETAIAIGIAVAGLCGWLTKISIDLGKLLSSTDHRISDLEAQSLTTREAIIDHDRRIGRLEVVTGGQVGDE